MKLSRNKKILIFTGLALIILAYPIGLLIAQLFSPAANCTDNFLPSICVAGFKSTITIWTTVILFLAGSITILVSSIKKK